MNNQGGVRMKSFKNMMLVAGLCLLSTAAVADYSDYGFGRNRGESLFNQFSSSYRQPEALPSHYVRQVQRVLAQRGFYDGRVDGVWGPRTTTAIRRYQRSEGNEPTGMLTTTTLDNLGIWIDDNTRAMKDDADETIRRNRRSNEH
jgi:hypothetical protein